MSEKNKLTIKDQMMQLENLLSWFEGEDFNLEDSFEKYKEAAELSREIEKTLDGMKNKIEVLSSLHQV